MTEGTLISRFFLELNAALSELDNEQDILAATMPLFLRKLNAFAIAFAPLVGEVKSLPLHLAAEPVFIQAINNLKEITLRSKFPIQLQLDDRFFSFYSIPRYGHVIIGRAKPFDTFLLNELNPLVQNVGKVLKLAHEIDQRKKAEKELKRTAESLKLLQSFVENTIDSVQVADVNGQMVYINQEAERRFGISQGDIENYHVSQFDKMFAVPGVWEKHVETLRSVESQTIASSYFDTRYQANRSIEVLVSLRKILDKEFIIAISRDTTERFTVQQELERKEEMLRAIASASEELLSNKNVLGAIAKSLERIGKAVKVDRTYFFQNEVHPELGEITSQRFEWNSGSAAPQIDNPDLQDLPIGIFGEFLTQLKQNKPYEAIVAHIPDEELKGILEAQEIISILIIPVFFRGLFWGFVGYDECKYERKFTDTELSLLQAFSNSISTALERQDNEREIESMAKFPQENPDPVVRLDAKGAVILRNAASEGLNVFEIDDNTYSDNFFFKLVASHFADDSGQRNYQLKANGQTFLITARKPQSESYINLYFNNVTRLKVAEQELLNARSMLQSILNEMHDVVWAMSLPDEEMLFVSPSAATLYGVNNSQDLMQRNAWKRFVHKPYIPLLEQFEINLRQQGNSDLEYQIITQSGEQKWVMHRAKVVYNSEQKPIRVDGYVRDITRNKIFEQELRAQEEKYRSIIANMNLGLLEVDLNDTILFANQSFCEMSGYALDELKGKTASTLFLAGDHKQTLIEKNKEREQGLSDMYEVPARNKQGKLKWWLVSGAPRYNSKGAVVGSIGIHLDITNQKNIEQELKEAKTKAEESAQVKERFLINMSHEIRTPLNAIIGMLRQLEKGKLNAEERTYLSHTQNASAHLLSIVNNILDLSKIEAGQLLIEQKPFSIAEVFQYVSGIFSPMAQEKMLDFTSTLDPKLWPQHLGDATRIRQVLINLVGNALKFTHTGIVSMSCELLSDTAHWQKFKIEVQDTGIGMEPAYLNKLFDKFSQEDVSTARKYGGSGLGMPITAELIRLMDAEISVESHKGKGTKFTLLFNLQKGNEAESPNQNSPSSSYKLKGKRLLLVEDNEINRLVAAQTLSGYSIELVEAENGQEAIDLLAQQSFDLILMDLQMPVLDGIEATKIIRQKMKLNTPIIALSANAFKSEVDKCKAAGMNDYITKPFDEKTLLKAILQTLNADTSQELMSQNIEHKASTYSLHTIIEMSRGNEDFVHKMAKLFAEHSAPAVGDMKKALSEGDLVGLGKIAHRIKPSILNLNMNGIAEEIRSLERAHEGQISIEEINQQLNKVEVVIQAAVADLKEKGYL